MKKNWNNPELKNLELVKTNQEVECSAQQETKDGIHLPFNCHHGLNYNVKNCPHVKWYGIVPHCKYEEKVTIS